MDKQKLIKSLSALLLTGVAVFFLFYYEAADKPKQYYINQGHIFGTYYNIRYEAERDLETELLNTLNAVDASLSAFNAESTISRINSNTSMQTDSMFEVVFTQARQISALTDGCFDITVAPLVNLWGFGFKNGLEISDSAIDSIMPFIGYEKVELKDHTVIKTDNRLMLDASAIAKGFGCDMAAACLRKHGCTNLLVDIGGEVVAEGINDSGNTWRVGISTPEDDPEGGNHEISQIVTSDKFAMATSGNYRRFYYDNGIRRSHTIDPHSGYPVNHSLLSATVIAPTCTQADALATACMVMGAEKALLLIESLPDTEAYFISSKNDKYVVETTSGMKKFAYSKEK